MTVITNIIVLSVLYIPCALYLLRELKLYPDVEARKERKTVPILVVASALYLCLMYKTLSFAAQGYLPLI